MNDKAPRIHIERIPVASAKVDEKHFFEEFVRALTKIPPGSSFLVPSVPSHFRVAIRTMHLSMGRVFKVRKEGDQYRVGRLL